jgi:hypothetical protein
MNTGLPHSCNASILITMRIAKTALLVVAIVSLATHGFDCLAMTTSEQAMQCCTTMPCAPNGHHGQDCCKTMPSAYPPFVQPPTGHVLPFGQIGTMPSSGLFANFYMSFEGLTAVADSLGPPREYSPAALPIRI